MQAATEDATLRGPRETASDRDSFDIADDLVSPDAADENLGALSWHAATAL